MFNQYRSSQKTLNLIKLGRYIITVILFNNLLHDGETTLKV
jgi:hypothetical protein